MEILFSKTSSSVDDVSANVRWLNVDELPVYNRHLVLCGQKTLSAERWNTIVNEGTIYCGLFADGEMVARAAVEKYSEDKWEVSDVRTAREYRNHGCARQVCLFVMNYIFRHGRTATIRTEIDNTPMLSVIRSLGFEKTAAEE